MGRPSSDPLFLPLLPPSVYLPPLPSSWSEAHPTPPPRQGNLTCRFCVPRRHSTKCAPLGVCARTFKFAGCPVNSVGRSPCREFFLCLEEAWHPRCRADGQVLCSSENPSCCFYPVGQLRRGPPLCGFHLELCTSPAFRLPRKPPDLKESLWGGSWLQASVC